MVVARKDHRWIALAVVALAQLMVVLDSTIVTIALPSAQSDLGFSNDSRAWIVTAYALAFGSLLLLGGRISDIMGRKQAFIVGLLGFAGASALGGAADGFGLLVTARALQGASGALLAPAALGILTTTFSDPKDRGKAFGVFGAIAGSGVAVGLLLGGVLTEYLSWRWCMFVNVIFAVVAAVGAVLVLRRASAGVKPRIDIPGTVAVTIGLFGIVYGFSRAETHGWSDALTIGSLVGGILMLVVFGLLQTRVPHPLLPPRVILNRDRGGSYLVLALVTIGILATFLFLTYYLTGTLGYSALQTGFAFLPLCFAIMFTSTMVSARILPIVGARIMVATGGLMAAGGMALLTRTGLDSGYAEVVLPALLLMGPGIGLVFPAALNTATAGVMVEDAGVASAMVNAMQQIGGAIGTALLSTLSAGAVAAYQGSHGTSADELASANLAGYHMVFWTTAAVFVGVAVVGGTVLDRHSVRKARTSRQARSMVLSSSRTDRLAETPRAH